MTKSPFSSTRSSPKFDARPGSSPSVALGLPDLAAAVTSRGPLTLVLSRAAFGLLGAVTVLARLVDLPRVYDLSLTAAMALQGFGEAFGVYDRVLRFDDLVQFTLPMLTAPVVYIALARLDVVPDPRDETHLQHYVGIFVVTAALGIAICALWEIVEWRPDAWFST